MLRVAIIGSRDYPAPHLVGRAVAVLIQLLGTDWLLVSGGARGPDRLGEQRARDAGVPTKVFKADWSQGKRAGFDRNTDIVAQADLVIAFWDGSSSGTWDSIQKAKKMGRTVWVIGPDGSEMSV